MREANRKRMERICLFPGSFDPVTCGHVDLIRRASAMYDRVVVAVGENSAKRGCFSTEERLSLLRRCLDGLDNVETAAYSGLTVRFAREIGAGVMLRGVRDANDVAAEASLAAVNRHLCPEIETVLLPCRPELAGVSSTVVRELAAYGADLTGYVPDEIISLVREHFEQNKQA